MCNPQSRECLSRLWSSTLDCAVHTHCVFRLCSTHIASLPPQLYILQLVQSDHWRKLLLVSGSLILIPIKNCIARSKNQAHNTSPVDTHIASLDCAVHTHCLSRLCSTHTLPLYTVQYTHTVPLYTVQYTHSASLHCAVHTQCLSTLCSTHTVPLYTVQ